MPESQSLTIDSILKVNRHFPNRSRVLTREEKLKEEDGGYTKNVVYKQILLSHPQIFIKYIKKNYHTLILILITRHTKLILYSLYHN